MPGVTRIEDLRAWQKARELHEVVCQLTTEGPMTHDHRMAEQMRSAAFSAMSNVAEGFHRFGRREFLQFLSIAKGSCGEVMSLLYAARGAGHLSEAGFQAAFAKANEAIRMITALRTSIANRAPRASKPRINDGEPST